MILEEEGGVDDLNFYKVWNLQYPKRSQYLSGICPLRHGPGQHRPGGDAREKFHWKSLREGVGRILGGCVECARPTPWRHGTILSVVAKT